MKTKNKNKNKNKSKEEKKSLEIPFHHPQFGNGYIIAFDNDNFTMLDEGKTETKSYPINNEIRDIIHQNPISINIGEIQNKQKEIEAKQLNKKISEQDVHPKHK